MNELSYLNPNGKAVNMLKQLEELSDQSQRLTIEKIASFLGAVREKIPSLTNAHEDELYDWLVKNINNERTNSKIEFIANIGARVMRLDFDPAQPLNLERVATKTYIEENWEAQIDEVKKLIKEKQEAMEEDKKRYIAANLTVHDIEAKLDPLDHEIIALQRKLQNLLLKKSEISQSNRTIIGLFDNPAPSNHASFEKKLQTLLDILKLHLPGIPVKVESKTPGIPVTLEGLLKTLPDAYMPLHDDRIVKYSYNILSGNVEAYNYPFGRFTQSPDIFYSNILKELSNLDKPEDYRPFRSNILNDDYLSDSPRFNYQVLIPFLQDQLDWWLGEFEKRFIDDAIYLPDKEFDSLAALYSGDVIMNGKVRGIFNYEGQQYVIGGIWGNTKITAYTAVPIEENPLPAKPLPYPGYNYEPGRLYESIKVSHRGKEYVMISPVEFRKLSEKPKIKNYSYDTFKVNRENGYNDAEMLKQIQETAIHIFADHLIRINANWDEKSIYSILCAFYRDQPVISTRSSQSLMLQQYSTPTILGYLLSKFAIPVVKYGDEYLEPSAGTGLLTIGTPPAYWTVNEIDKERLTCLKFMGFKNTFNEDSNKPYPWHNNYAAVITNPPFGNGEKISFDGYQLRKLEHRMAAFALQHMRPDGKAAIIIGGNTIYGKESGMIEPVGTDRVFIAWLYFRFNVKDIINVSGLLYNKMGAVFPIRIILIDGHRTTGKGRPFFFSEIETLPATMPGSNEQVKDVDTLYERVYASLKK